MQTDVLIVGAGPTGLALSLQLTRYGVDHVVIEKREGTTPHSKAIGVQARTLEIYDQMRFADELVSKGWKADRVRLIGNGEVRGEIDLSGIGAGMSPFPFLLVLEQGKHEEILYRKIRELGGEIGWRKELLEFAENESGVTANVALPGGGYETISAKYLIACDGAHSQVRRSLGIAFEGSTFERLFYVADVEIDWEFPHDALHVNLGDDTLTAFFPMMGERRWRIVGTFPEGHDKDEGEILFDEIERQVAMDTALKFDIANVHWFSVYKVHSRAVDTFSKGRCFLAGDAAHIHTPAGAQGMNTGIQDGYNLAWKLAAVLRQGATASLLDTYNEERLPNARRLLSTTDRFFDFAASDDPLTSFLRKNVFPYLANIALSFDAVKQLVFPLVSQIGISYATSSLSAGKGFNVKAGERIPWFRISGESIYDRLREPKFHVLYFTDGSEIEPLPDGVMDRWERFLDINVVDLNEVIRNVFGADSSFLIILRPDNYIGLISGDISARAVTGYLERYIALA